MFKACYFLVVAVPEADNTVFFLFKILPHAVLVFWTFSRRLALRETCRTFRQLLSSNWPSCTHYWNLLKTGGISSRNAQCTSSIKSATLFDAILECVSRTLAVHIWYIYLCKCRCDRYDRWRVVSIWSQRSLYFLLSDRSDHSGRRAYMETSLKLYICTSKSPTQLNLDS